MSVFDIVPVIEDPEEHRCACLLLLDISYSMTIDDRIGHLNRGLKILTQSLNDDPLARKRVEVAIMTFGGEVKVQTEFTAARDFRPPTLSAGGGTPMGQAITDGIDMLKARTHAYRQNGVLHFRPWIMLITDGEPTDTDDYPWSQVGSLVKQGEGAKDFMFFPIGVKGADFKALGQLSATSPMELQGVKFRELFQWLSGALSRVSSSRPGDGVDLEPPTGWGRIPGD